MSDMPRKIWAHINEYACENEGRQWTSEDICYSTKYFHAATVEQLIEALEAALECIEYNDLAAINTTTMISAALARVKG